MSKEENTPEWSQYESGTDYKSRIDLYSIVNRNEAFFIGDQWKGVVSNGLPTPVFNYFKRIINFIISFVMSSNIKLQYTPENVGDDPASEEEAYIKNAAEILTSYSDTFSERRKLNKILRQCLLDAAISGDACTYKWWDSSLDNGQMAKGDINIDTVDNVNVMFGDPNNDDVQTQPYIIIASRELVSVLKDEAKKNGIPQTKIDLISSDEDTEYQSGDRAKIELDHEGVSGGKTISLLKLWKKDGKIMAKKITRCTDIRKDWDTKLSLYPVAWMNWDKRKNSCHGQAVGTGLIPNQVFINKMFAMAMMSQMHVAFPKVIYNKTLITAWNNQIGAAVGVEGMGADFSVGNVAQFMNPGNMSQQVFQLIDLVIQQTKDTLGANDAALGDISPEKASGISIMAAHKNATTPLASIQQNLYQMVEDIGYICLDYMANYYGVRKIAVEKMGKRVIEEFDFARLKTMNLRIKIDVGPSSYWSEITAMQTLDNLLKEGHITFKQYLDRMPSGVITKKEELITDIDNQDMQKQFVWEQMARFMETLPPELQMELQSLPPEEMEAKLMEMMMQPPEVQQQGQQQAQAQQEQMMMQEQQAQQMAQQQEQMKGEQDFQRQMAMKEMDINGKMALESMKQEKVGAK